MNNLVAQYQNINHYPSASQNYYKNGIVVKANYSDKEKKIWSYTAAAAVTTVGIPFWIEAVQEYKEIRAKLDIQKNSKERQKLKKSLSKIKKRFLRFAVIAVLLPLSAYLFESTLITLVNKYRNYKRNKLFNEKIN